MDSLKLNQLIADLKTSDNICEKAVCWYLRNLQFDDFNALVLSDDEMVREIIERAKNWYYNCKYTD